MKSLTVVGSAQINSFLIDQGVPIRTVIEKQEFNKAKKIYLFIFVNTLINKSNNVENTG